MATSLSVHITISAVEKTLLECRAVEQHVVGVKQEGASFYNVFIVVTL